jgi:uncharacterized cupin superfamily protein
MEVNMALESDSRRPLIRAVEAKKGEQSFSHPLNPESEMIGFSLSEAAGMQRLGVHLIRVPAGKESCIYHSHFCEEEFLYILAGRGIAEIDSEEHDVGAGDFLGFAAPSVAHSLRNPFDEDLVYLVGGERREVEIGDFPHLKKRVLRLGSKAEIVDWDDLSPFWDQVDPVP